MELNKPYERGEFIKFLSGFLPDDYDPSPAGEIIPVSSGLIKKVVYLGGVASLDNLKVFEIEHQSEHDPRVTITKEICRLMASRGYRKAIAVFTSKKSENYRLSLITIEINLEGKRTKKEYSNPRRYSFYLGPDAKVHTPSDYLIKKKTIKSLDDLIDRFNVELVTKEFFQKYKELYEKARKHLESDRGFGIFAGRNNVDLDTFAKKLLGQIVFLYFIQRKGWLGAAKGAPISSGDKNFVRSLFIKAKKEGKHFFNDYLEYLFYDALNKKPEKPGSFYRDYFDCQIPFLNGGLFEPIENYNWRNEALNIPDSLFSNNQEDGILDVFDLFNFTVYEDDPIDKEVSIDPEMLGKVFENLLPENLRKGKGAFYTPREIVHYMCQESLINYLAEKSEIKTEEIRDYIKRSKISTDGTADIPACIAKKAKIIDDLLAEIKIVDPAVGSGAFLVGMLHEIVNFRTGLNNVIKKKRAEYELKKQAIINSLYGVDIDPGAVEIAKLRLWLSLVVDYALDDIDPLPNLDFKIMQGNSLIELLSPTLLAKTTDSSRNRLIDELNKIKSNYSLLTDHSEKKEAREQINKLVRAIVNYDIEKERKRIWDQIMSKKAQTKLFIDSDETMPLPEAEDKDTKKLSKQLQELEKAQRISPIEHFEWHINFNEVFETSGFDVVIANPPYDVYQGHRKGEIEQIRKYPIYDKATGGKLNAYKLFLAKSLNLQKPKGVLCEIFQNSFLADNSASKIRQYFLRNQNILKIDSFPERDAAHLRVFENVKMSVCILVSHNVKIENYTFMLKIWKDKYMCSARQISLTNQEVIDYDAENAAIPSTDQAGINILRKVSINPRLKTIGKCYEGEINLTFHKKYLRKEKSGNAQMIKGAAVQKWIIKAKMSQGEIEYLDKTAYLKDNASNKSQHHKLKRIVMQGITGVDENNRLKMTIIGPGIFCGNSVNYVLVTDENVSDNYLLSLLNSKLLNWCFKIFSTNSNVNGYEVDNLPICELPLTDQKPFDIVNKIFAITKCDDYLEDRSKQAKVCEYEKQIDQMVYKLYGLTKEEIAVVEGEKRQMKPMR